MLYCNTKDFFLLSLALIILYHINFSVSIDFSHEFKCDSLYYLHIIFSVKGCLSMIRYKIDVMKALKEKGFTSTRMRISKILSESTMSKLRSKDTSITMKNLDVICKLLNCQPNDIIEYIPDEQTNH